MNKYLKVLPVLLMVGLIGCGGSEAEKASQIEVKNTITTTNNSSTSTNNRQAKTHDDYVSPLPDDAPVYTVAMTGATPPFSYQDDYQIMSGIDVDVIRAIGEEAGFKVKFHKSTSWNDMFASAESGESDLAMSGISYRAERDKKYSLSEAYFFNPIAIAYTKPELKATSLAALNGKKIGAVVDSTSVGFASKVANAHVIEEDTPYLAYADLVRGNIDATIYDYPVWQHYAKQMPEVKVIIQPIENASNKNAHAVILAHKENAELIKTVNEGLAKVQETGKIEQIKSKWLAKLNIEDKS